MLAIGIQVFVGPNCRAKVLLRFRGLSGTESHFHLVPIVSLN